MTNQEIQDILLDTLKVIRLSIELGNFSELKTVDLINQALAKAERCKL